uniref:Uncharacterized protein n=1 Tax=Anopheles farauti TaxID=69004 RepID=A0A182QTP1_9DIPT
MIVRIHLSILVSFILSNRGCYCSFCLYHEFYDKFYTDLNYIIEDFDSNIWYVLAFQKPSLPYRTLYHLPQDIVTNRNCYSYTLRTRLGVILMELVCREALATYNSYDIFTRPSGVYVTGRKHYQQEVQDFRVVNVLQLTKTTVLLLSCSTTLDTYGFLVLSRESPAVTDTKQVHKIIESRLPYPLHRWINYTVTTVSTEKCNCNVIQCTVYNKPRELRIHKH